MNDRNELLKQVFAKKAEKSMFDYGSPDAANGGIVGAVGGAGAGGLLGAGLGAAAGAGYHYLRPRGTEEEEAEQSGLGGNLLRGALIGGAGGLAGGALLGGFGGSTAGAAVAGTAEQTAKAREAMNLIRKGLDSLPNFGQTQTPSATPKAPVPAKPQGTRGTRVPTQGSGPSERLVELQSDMAERGAQAWGLPVAAEHLGLGPLGGLLSLAIRNQRAGEHGMQAEVLPHYQRSAADWEARQAKLKKESSVKEALVPQPQAPQPSWLSGLFNQSIFGGHVRPWWTSQASWDQRQQQQQQRQAQRADSRARYPAPPQPTQQALQQAQARATQAGKENPLPMQNHWLWGQQVDETKAREQSVARNTQHRANAAQAGAFRTKALDADVRHAQAQAGARLEPAPQAPAYNFQPSGAKPWSQATAKTAAFYSRDAANYGLAGAGLGALAGGLDYALDDKKDEEDSPGLLMRMLASGGMGGLGGAAIGSHINDRVSPIEAERDVAAAQARANKSDTSAWQQKLDAQQESLRRYKRMAEMLQEDLKRYEGVNKRAAFESALMGAGKGGLLGAGLGAVVGGAYDYMQDEEDRDPNGLLSAALTGGVLGGGVGAAAGGLAGHFGLGEKAIDPLDAPLDMDSIPSMEDRALARTIGPREWRKMQAELEQIQKQHGLSPEDARWWRRYEADEREGHATPNWRDRFKKRGAAAAPAYKPGPSRTQRNYGMGSGLNPALGKPQAQPKAVYTPPTMPQGSVSNTDVRKHFGETKGPASFGVPRHVIEGMREQARANGGKGDITWSSGNVPMIPGLPANDPRNDPRNYGGGDSAVLGEGRGSVYSSPAEYAAPKPPATVAQPTQQPTAPIPQAPAAPANPALPSANTQEEQDRLAHEWQMEAELQEKVDAANARQPAQVAPTPGPMPTEDAPGPMNFRDLQRGGIEGDFEGGLEGELSGTAPQGAGAALLSGMRSMFPKHASVWGDIRKATGGVGDWVRGRAAGTFGNPNYNPNPAKLPMPTDLESISTVKDAPLPIRNEFAQQALTLGPEAYRKSLQDALAVREDQGYDKQQYDRLLYNSVFHRLFGEPAWQHEEKKPSITAGNAVSIAEQARARLDNPWGHAANDYVEAAKNNPYATAGLGLGALGLGGAASYLLSGEDEEQERRGLRPRRKKAAAETPYLGIAAAGLGAVGLADTLTRKRKRKKPKLESPETEEYAIERKVASLLG